MQGAQEERVRGMWHTHKMEAWLRGAMEAGRSIDRLRAVR